MNPCAWCLAERGEPPKPESHGICRHHRNQLLGVPQVRVWYWGDTGWPVQPMENPQRFGWAGTLLMWSASAFLAIVAGLFVGQLVALTVDWLSKH